jgi:hypothetical protein
MKLRRRAQTAATGAHPVPQIESPVRASDLTIASGGGRIGELLLDAALVTRDQVVAALQDSQRGAGKRIGQLLVDRVLSPSGTWYPSSPPSTAWRSSTSARSLRIRRRPAC